MKVILARIGMLLAGIIFLLLLLEGSRGDDVRYFKGNRSHQSEIITGASEAAAPVNIDAVRLRTWIYNNQSFRILTFQQTQFTTSKLDIQIISSQVKTRDKIIMFPVWLLHHSSPGRDDIPPLLG